MKRSWLFLSLLFLSISAIAQQDSIDVFVNKQIKQQGLVGVSIGVIRNGKIIKAKGYGLSNIELGVPASEKTVYKIGSVSKQFVAVSILKLVKEGKLKLSDPVKKYIRNAPRGWNAITILHLLHHTSGLPIDPPAFDGMKDQADSVYIKAAFSVPLNFPVGSKFEYSNFGYFVLADIIRIVSGHSFADYMQKNVFEAYGMQHTRTTSADAIIKNRAGGYIKNSKDSIRNAPNWVAVRPSGAFLSTIDDMLKWELVMQNNKLLAKEDWPRLWTDTVKTPMTMDNEVVFYGYGWMTNKVSGKPFVHHAGSLPGFRSVYCRYLEDKTAIIVLTNVDYADTYGIAFGIADLLPKAD
jgi:CubicO group peptidase (beta-lactamase class C family)